MATFWKHIARTVFILLFFAAVVSGVRAQKPCCTITVLDVQTHIVTAEVSATHQTFTFQVADARLFAGLRPGLEIFANFKTNEVSLNGKSACCKILKMGGAATSAPIGRGAPPPGPTPTIAPPPAAAPAQAPVRQTPPATPQVTPPATPQAGSPCCSVTAVNNSSGVVSAHENTTGRAFSFKVSDPRILETIRTGQGVFANFKSQQVSLDGKTACCTILPGVSSESGKDIVTGQTPTTSIGTQPSVLTGDKPGAQRSAGSASPMHAAEVVHSYVLPPVTAGTPQPLQGTGSRRQGGVLERTGRVNPSVVHLYGLDGIQQAKNLPEGIRNILLLHASTLGAEQVDHYIVNTQQAAEWFKTHPALANVKPPASHNSHAGCKALSTNCVSEAVKHAEGEAARQSEKYLNEAREEWRHVTHELAHELQEAESCFADATLTLHDVPINVSKTPEFTLNFDRDGKTHDGSASGKVHGDVKLGFPIDANFVAQVDMFYIPCLPFAIRPKRVTADGTLGAGARLSATLIATGQFNQEFTVPPGGGPHFPIYMIPIVIAGVPIAELDVAIYVDGKVYIDGEGKLEGDFVLNTQRSNTAIAFDCSGKGCLAESHGLPATPETTSESVKLEGRVHVKPAVYTALQLDFDIDALSARVGPQPFLLGEVYGCGAASGTQTQGAASTAETSYALTADLDWGVDLRAEALVGGQQVGQTLIRTLVSQRPPKHLNFWDLAHSTALVPRVEGITQVSAGQPVLYKIRMPACYPYTDKVKYRLSWTGDATASTNVTQTSAAGNQGASIRSSKPGGTGISTTPASDPGVCSMQSGQGECQSDPVKDLTLSLVWPSAGAYSLTVTAVGDTPHQREFKPVPQPTTLAITVQP